MKAVRRERERAETKLQIPNKRGPGLPSNEPRSEELHSSFHLFTQYAWVEAGPSYSKAIYHSKG